MFYKIKDNIVYIVILSMLFSIVVVIISIFKFFVHLLLNTNFIRRVKLLNVISYHLAITFLLNSFRVAVSVDLTLAIIQASSHKYLVLGLGSNFCLSFLLWFVMFFLLSF